MQSYDDAFRALEEGRVDAAAVPEFVHRRHLIERPDLRLDGALQAADFAYALAVRHGQDDFLRAINTCVFLWEQDGTLSKINERFIGGPQPASARL